MKKIITKNFTVGRAGLDMALFFVIHTYNGAGRSLYNWFQNNDENLSSHFAVFLDGEFEQYVEIGNTAHHSGNNWVNIRSIGIEHQDNGIPSDSVRTDKLYETTANLIASTALSLGIILLGEYNIKPHKEFTDTGCPGGLDINRIRESANKKLQSLLAPRPDNLYRVLESGVQKGAFSDKDNAFNVWYTNKNQKVIYNSLDITYEFKNMAKELETQILNLKTEIQNLQNSGLETSELLRTAQDTILAQTEQIEALQLEIKALKDNFLYKIYSLFFKKRT